MNKIKKLSIMLVALVMCVVLGVTTWAAEDSNADFSALLSGESTLHVSGEERTVTVTVAAKAPVSIFSLDAAIIIPDGWSATVSSTLTGFTAEKNYGDGRAAWYTGANVSATELLVITYTIPAEATGTFELGVRDLELGQLSGSGWNVVAQDVTASTTLTINAHSDVDTDDNHSCDTCNKENVTAHTHKTYGKDDDTHWSICNCGETIANTTVGHTYDQDGDKCVCGAEKPADPVTGLKGDIDLDGDVDMDDLTYFAEHIAKIITITNTQSLGNAEVTGDGEVTMDDLTKLAEYIAKIIPDLD